MKHSFDVLNAKQYGIIQAVILDNLQFWIYKNKCNNKHFYEGHYWTYNSAEAFQKIFEYLTVQQIRYSLDKLVELNVIIKGNFSENKHDHTNWYAFVDENKWLTIHENSEPDLLNLRDRSTNFNKSSITDNKPDYKPDSPPFLLSKLLFDLIIERNPNHKEPDLQKWAKHIDLMIRRDKREAGEIEQVIKWTQKNSFWQNNILSTEKLREQYDRLKLQAEQNDSNRGSSQGRGQFNRDKYERLLSTEEK